MTNMRNKKGQLVRWESYEKDRQNLIVSKKQNCYIILNLGNGKGRSKKNNSIRQYEVIRDSNGEGHCTCEDHIKNNTVCKHQLAVWNKAKQDRLQSEKKREVRVRMAIDRW